MKRRIAPLLIALVVIALGVVLIHTIAHRERATDILGSGIIEADEVRVSSKIGGRLAELLVREGDEVKAGQAIARLEHADIDAEGARARAAVDSAQAGLADLERGSRPEQIAASRARLAEAIAARRGAEEQLRTAGEAYGKVTELKQAVDEARARTRLADARLAQAKAQLDEAKRGATPEEVETLRAAVAQADAHVAAARTTLANAEEVYTHQSAIEGPLIAATTEETVAGATAGLAQKEASRADELAKGDATTQQTVDRAKAEEAASAAKLAGATRGVQDAQEQVALTRAQAQQMRDAAESALEEALRARDAAKAKLDVLLAGTREERIRLAEAAVRAAEAEADAAKDALGNASTAYDDRLLARQQRDAADTAVKRAKAAEEAAQAELSLLLAGQTKEAIEVARGRLSEAQAALEAVKVREGYCDIVAPTAGTVTEKVLDAGEMAGPGAAIVVLSDLQNMWLRAYLDFTTLGSIVKGQRLDVVTDAAPGRTFHGVVIRVSNEAEFTPKDVQTRDQRVKQVYWIKVGVGDGEGLLKPGMPADAKLPAKG
jgi:HlyD family secretion protein